MPDGLASNRDEHPGISAAADPIVNIHHIANTQRLFVRLFSRECKWIRIQSLSYKEIDIPDAFDELSRNELGFADTGTVERIVEGRCRWVKLKSGGVQEANRYPNCCKLFQEPSSRRS